eukprot:scpid48865/ scgid22968/ Iron/zinc purple acid phosphatase-like protein
MAHMDWHNLVLLAVLISVIANSTYGIQQGYSPYNDCKTVESVGAEKPRSSLWSTPSQLRLSVTGCQGEMALTWVSAAHLLDISVKVGKSRTALNDVIIAMANITMTSYAKPSRIGDSPKIYRTILRPLEPNTRYFYQVVSGGDTGNIHYATRSKVYSFTTAPAAAVRTSSSSHPAPSSYPVRWLFLADHGTKPESQITAITMRKLANLAVSASMKPDLVIHGGDMAYGNGVDYHWDEWGKFMEPITATVPYMVVAGNHELVSGDSGGENGVPLMHRFHMPYPDHMPAVDHNSTLDGRAFWYSFDWGPVHFVAVSTEHDTDAAQRAWLREDLSNASSSEHVDWIVTFGHAPIYTSNIRHGNKTTLRSWLAPLLDEFSVDLSLWGHDHSYERLYPIHNGKVTSQSYDSNRGTVHVICGSSGWQLHDCWKATAMSAFHSANSWGFLSLNVFNSTALQIDYVSNSNDSHVLDSVVVRRASGRAHSLSSSHEAPTKAETVPPTNSSPGSRTPPPTFNVSITSTSSSRGMLSSTYFPTGISTSSLSPAYTPSSNGTDITHTDSSFRYRLLFVVWLLGGIAIAYMIYTALLSLGVVGADSPGTKLVQPAEKKLLTDLRHSDEEEEETL